MLWNDTQDEDVRSGREEDIGTSHNDGDSDTDW